MNESFSPALIAIDACAAAPATMNLAGLPLDFSTPGSNTGTVKAS